ncbi:ABC transporter permease [Amycolatopsis sp. NPDC049868]|uniref:ABC transporter permease n=1 Tax=Amycolatopsis sp. NPDC049868 TaxID=3363934 RepID=UPI0037A75882
MSIRPADAARHSLILAGRGLRKIRRNPAYLVDVTVQPLLFLVMFAYLFGGAIAGSPDTYLQRLVPGLLAPSVLMATLSAGVSLNTDVGTGVFDRLRSMPIARSAPLAGAVLAGTIRYLVAIVVVLVVGTALGFRIRTGPLEVLAGAGLLVLAGLCFCWVTVFLGMVLRQPDTVQGTAIAVFMPMVFASSVFVPSATLPGWLRVWSELNPVSLLADAERGLLDGGPVAAPVTGALLWSAAVLAVFFPLALRGYHRRVG